MLPYHYTSLQYYNHYRLTRLPQVLLSEPLIHLMDVFSESRKGEIRKEVLAAFARGRESTADPILLHTLLDMARHLHDSLDSLSAQGTSRHIASLISGFVVKIDFGRDLEQQLNLLVECRAAFPNLEPVL